MIFCTSENRLVAAMGGPEFATGVPRLIVNPFPQTTRPTEPPVMIEDSFKPVETEMHSNQISPIPYTSHNDVIPASSTIPAPFTPLQNTIPSRPHRRRRRSSIQKPLDASMDQFASIEARRVEAEMITAQAFAKLSENIGNIASALTSIANAISGIARKMPNL